MDDNILTKTDKREQKRRNKRKMKVDGASARLWNKLIVERAEKIRKNKKEGQRNGGKFTDLLDKE